MLIISPNISLSTMEDRHHCVRAYDNRSVPRWLLVSTLVIATASITCTQAFHATFVTSPRLLLSVNERLARTTEPNPNGLRRPHQQSRWGLNKNNKDNRHVSLWYKSDATDADTMSRNSTSVAELYRPPNIKSSVRQETLPATTTFPQEEVTWKQNEKLNGVMMRETEQKNSNDDMGYNNVLPKLVDRKDNTDSNDEDPLWWQDYVVVDKAHAETDASLRMVSSELGIMKLNGERQHDATVAHAMLAARALD